MDEVYCDSCGVLLDEYEWENELCDYCMWEGDEYYYEDFDCE